MKPNTEQMKAGFERHRAQSDISADDYLRSKQIALAESFEQAKIVYLDMWVWIRIGDAALKQKKDPEISELHALLSASVAASRIVCPVSEATFLELLRQSDDRTRQATAQLIDSLSGGLCFTAPDFRINTEVAYFVHANGSDQILHPLDHLVWTRTCYVLGVAHPFDARLPEQEQRVIQKAFLDHLWNLPLSEMVGTLDPAQWDTDAIHASAERLNELNRVHQIDLQSFRRTYNEEVVGAANLFAPVARKVVSSMYSKATGQSPPEQTSEQAQQTEHTLRALMALAVINDKSRHILRSFHIQAMFHAAVRWDRQRKISGSLLFDFQHAMGALAYCDAFLADRPMAALIQSNHMRLDQEMGCAVFSSPKALSQWLDALPGC